MELLDLPQNLQTLVEDELDPGERIEWLAQPFPIVSFPWAAILPMLFAIPWTGFAIFWMVMAGGFFEQGPQDYAQIVFSLFGLPFVLVGLGMLSSPVWIRRRARKAVAETAYVITDRRAIIFDNGYYGDGLHLALTGGFGKRLGAGLTIRSYFPPRPAEH